MSSEAKRRILQELGGIPEEVYDELVKDLFAQMDEMIGSSSRQSAATIIRLSEIFLIPLKVRRRTCASIRSMSWLKASSLRRKKRRTGWS